mgnify:CR=1 FL=1
MGFPLDLINKIGGRIVHKNKSIHFIEANASRMERIPSLEDIDQLHTMKLGLHV